MGSFDFVVCNAFSPIEGTDGPMCGPFYVIRGSSDTIVLCGSEGGQVDIDDSIKVWVNGGSYTSYGSGTRGYQGPFDISSQCIEGMNEIYLQVYSAVPSHVALYGIMYCRVTSATPRTPSIVPRSDGMSSIGRTDKWWAGVFSKNVIALVGRFTGGLYVGASSGSTALTIDGKKITGVGTPTVSSDATNKSYVDTNDVVELDTDSDIQPKGA